MIYGNYAKQYASNTSSNNSNTYKVISESDSIINYLIKEQDTYNNLLLNESYMDDNERLVMEAKIEVLQEVVGVALQFAIGLIIGTIIALIIKFTGLLRKGSSILRSKLGGIIKPRDLSEEEKKKLEDEINELVSEQDIKGKEKLFKFSNVTFVGGNNNSMGSIDYLKRTTDLLGNFSHSLEDVANGSDRSPDEYVRIFKPYNDAINSDKKEFSVLNENIENGENPFLMSFAAYGKYEPVEARSLCKAFIMQKYYDQVTSLHDELMGKLKKVEPIFNDKKKFYIISKKFHPDEKGDTNYEEAFKVFTTVYRAIDDNLDMYKKILQNWLAAERFRMRYCTIASKYC